ncbi:Coiled-coil domain-containing protein 86 [Holothuria leucospilota]|uniref:Coiled-coil domain-containing protein 86 n=1 Tax=Holothuria leucospilota TaxID=206669 RepID=A0A9Q1HEB4_HOLLE|nr:Coiled-coil domain-containing protein 86 [Holothuria leucospilota]
MTSEELTKPDDPVTPGSTTTDPTMSAASVFETYKSESATSQPKGKPKSGRTWKTEQRKRFSDLKKDKPLRTSWRWKMEEKARLKSLKAYENELKENKQRENEELKQRRIAKQKRKEENMKKSEVVQVIKNTAKIKRMKKKQLKQIEKR